MRLHIGTWCIRARRRFDLDEPAWSILSEVEVQLKQPSSRERKQFGMIILGSKYT